MHNSGRVHRLISASELFVDHVEGVEHDYTIRLMVEARLGTLNGRVKVKLSISRLFLNVLSRLPDLMSLLLLNRNEYSIKARTLNPNFA